MRTNDKLRKVIKEARYLDVENTDRYRPIVRLFYLKYEKLKYWMYAEEVYEELREDPYFYDYTLEQCQQDLNALAGWGNLITIQDTRKVTTIEEFKNKKYRYQLSEAAVEIERMVIRLENLSLEGSSLEPSLLERLRSHLARIEEIAGEKNEQIYSWWNDLNNDFVRLNQNYQDYMRELNSVKAEEMMKTKEFLVFKDRLIDYLRTFVKSLQINVTAIEQSLKNVDESMIRFILKQVTQYELSIPRIDQPMDEKEIYDRMQGRWESIYGWFYGTDGGGSESGKIFDTTNEIIRKITRYATRISEQNNSGANRREEYFKLVKMFSGCGDIDEAHRLAASVFGMEKTLHLKGDFSRKTESINSGVFDEKPAEIALQPRVRTFKEKARRQGITDRSKEKEEMRREEIRRIEEKRKLLESYIRDGKLVFRDLGTINPELRDTFLSWLSLGMEDKEWKGKTEDGKAYRIEKHSEEICVLECTDGRFQMPDYEIIFEEAWG